MIEIRKRFLMRNDNLIKSLYPGTRKIHGPYLARDNRYRVVLYFGNNARPRVTTKQYCKLKMEIKLERRIEEPETVDHDNGKTRDDRYENLVLRDRSDHIKLDTKRRKAVKVKCVWCETKFMCKISGHGSNENKAGPFCSKRCRGKYGASVQNGGKRIKRVTYKKIYFNLKGTL